MKNGQRIFHQCMIQFGGIRKTAQALGVSERTVHYWKDGVTFPSARILKRISDAGIEVSGETQRRSKAG